MTPSFNILGLAAAVLIVAPLLSASPTGVPGVEVVQTRKITAWDGCSKSNKAKLEKDFKNAAELAQYAHDHMKMTDKAWTHYFRAKDEKNVKNLWDAVAKYEANDYSFTVRCAAKDDADCKVHGGSSFAATDPKPEEKGKPRELKVCPKYFTDEATKQSMDAKKYEPGKRGSWCKLAPYKFKDFSVGGLVLLHEITHLDAVGIKAKLPNMKQPAQAGSGASQYVDEGHSPRDTIEPWQNAESTAAAALEKWVMDKCKYDDIEV
ncbi:uncharacterized protein PG998_006441 [Apiospora kogelbergensis]|uniref:uncharacterized protein n=1 Tax=Apiospora kogelbergensis TaxID=1337665 RepID=UPI003130A61F